MEFKTPANYFKMSPLAAVDKISRHPQAASYRSPQSEVFPPPALHVQDDPLSLKVSEASAPFLGALSSAHLMPLP